MTDVVTIVSLGPGDPELITLKGLKILQKADYIFCPYTYLSGDMKISRAQDILTALDIDNAKIIPFKVSMSENRSEAVEVYKDIALQIEDAYKLGYKIAITAEGDAGIYSSSYYINEILTTKNIPVERIAGIPAFIACAASHNIPVSKQRETIGVITHFSSVEELKFKTEEYDTLILMKTSQYESVIKDAIKSFVNMTFHYFENSGVSEKEFYSTNREEILERKFPYFSLIIIQPLPQNPKSLKGQFN